MVLSFKEVPDQIEQNHTQLSELQLQCPDCKPYIDYLDQEILPEDTGLYYQENQTRKFFIRIL